MRSKLMLLILILVGTCVVNAEENGMSEGERTACEQERERLPKEKIDPVGYWEESIYLEDGEGSWLALGLFKLGNELKGWTGMMQGLAGSLPTLHVMEDINYDPKKGSLKFNTTLDLPTESPQGKVVAHSVVFKGSIARLSGIEPPYGKLKRVDDQTDESWFWKQYQQAAVRCD